jgi:hypothetical protein
MVEDLKSEIFALRMKNDTLKVDLASKAFIIESLAADIRKKHEIIKQLSLSAQLEILSGMSAEIEGWSCYSHVGTTYIERISLERRKVR